MCACALHPLEGRLRLGLTPRGELARLSDVWREVWVALSVCASEVLARTARAFLLTLQLSSRSRACSSACVAALSGTGPCPHNRKSLTLSGNAHLDTVSLHTDGNTRKQAEALATREELSSTPSTRDPPSVITADSSSPLKGFPRFSKLGNH